MTRLCLALWFVVLSQDAAEAQVVIDTIAGGGIKSMPAYAAAISVPAQMAFDSAGNLYFAVPSYNCVLRLDTSGIVTTVAGNTASAYPMVDGLATDVSIVSPTGVAVDNGNNLYIADPGHHAVRRLDVDTGAISTIAGTTGDTRLDAPGYLQLDGVGGLYLVDKHRIYKINLNTGDIMTVAGTGDAGFNGDGGPAVHADLNSPTGIAIDDQSNLYIADTGNRRVRRVDSVTGVITMVAGTGSNGSDGDSGPAAAASLSAPVDVAVDHGTTLYIADSFAANIRKVDLTSGLITTLVCLGQSRFLPSSCSTARYMRSYPVALRLDTEGNVLFVDAANRQIKTMLSSTGEITTTAGNGLSGYADQGGAATNGVLSLPRGTAVSSDGYLFVADSGNGSVRRVNLSSGEISTIFDSANVPQFSSVNNLSYPSHLALDELGNIYISDSEADRVYRENLDNGIISIVAGGGIGGDGGAAVGAYLNSPQGIALDKKGHLFIAEYGSNRVRMVDLQTGIITTVAGSGERLYSGDGGSGARK